MENLPKLEPLSLRPECELGYQKESWKPTWKCYCCMDTGLVLDRLSSNTSCLVEIEKMRKIREIRKVSYFPPLLQHPHPPHPAEKSLNEKYWVE